MAKYMVRFQEVHHVYVPVNAESVEEAVDIARPVFEDGGDFATEYSHTKDEVIVDTPDGSVVEFS